MITMMSLMMNRMSQILQGLYPSLQAEFPGGSYRLSPLPVRTLEKVWG